MARRIADDPNQWGKIREDSTSDETPTGEAEFVEDLYEPEPEHDLVEEQRPYLKCLGCDRVGEVNYDSDSTGPQYYCGSNPWCIP